MNDFAVDKDTEITLYLKECYGCNRYKKYDSLHEFLIDRGAGGINGGKGSFTVKRIELDPEWQEEAKELDVELPALLFKNPNGEKLILTYSKFIKRLNEEKESAKPSSDAGSRAGIESPVAPSKTTRRKNGNRKKTTRRTTRAKGKK